MAPAPALPRGPIKHRAIKAQWWILGPRPRAGPGDGPTLHPEGPQWDESLHPLHLGSSPGQSPGQHPRQNMKSSLGTEPSTIATKATPTPKDTNETGPKATEASHPSISFHRAQHAALRPIAHPNHSQPSPLTTRLPQGQKKNFRTYIPSLHPGQRPLVCMFCLTHQKRYNLTLGGCLKSKTSPG